MHLLISALDICLRLTAIAHRHTGEPEVVTKQFAASDEASYTLKRGSGVSWTVIDELNPRLINDTKYTENMVFFDGEKRKGTFLAVPLVRDGRASGMLCGDTLDSTTGHDLTEGDVRLFHAAAVVLEEGLERAERRLMETRRDICGARLAAAARDPSALPEPFCEAIVDAIEGVLPGSFVSVGMMDSAMCLRLVHRAGFDGARESGKAVTVRDKGREIPTIFQCFQIKTALTTRAGDGADGADSLTLPVVDPAAQQVSAAIYVATQEQDTGRSPLADPDTVAFLEDVARLAAQVLHTAPEGAVRRLGILSRAGAGDSAGLLALALELCARHTAASDAFVGFAHGEGRLRVVKSTGWLAEGSVVSSTDLPGCFLAMRTGLYYGSASDYVCAPLSGAGGSGAQAYGVVCLRVSMLDAEQQAALEGIARGLSGALAVSEFRRKMAVCGLDALRALMKRAAATGVYLSFLDTNGLEICGQVLGTVGKGIEVGRRINKEDSAQIIEEIRSAVSGVHVGFLGMFCEEASGDTLRASGADAVQVRKDVKTPTLSTGVCPAKCARALDEYLKIPAQMHYSKNPPLFVLSLPPPSFSLPLTRLLSLSLSLSLSL